MATSRPDIPKKLAARIRAAQGRVKDMRDSLVHAQKRRLQAQDELDLFHRDPEAYAAENYGTHGVDSYPVQTRTRRLAEDVEYRTRRIAEIERELPVLETELAEVEADVLAEVAIMRPSSGRVPWPNPLPSFKGRVERDLKAQRRQDAADRARAVIHRARLQAQFEREMEESDRQSKREDEAERRRFASLSPAQQEAERAEIRMFWQIMDEQGLSVKDLFSGLGTSDAFRQVEQELKARLSGHENGK